MNRFPHLESVALLAACAVVPSGLEAQQPGDPVTRRSAPEASPVRDQPAFVALDDVIGAKVLLRASAEERRDAAEDGEPADRPSGEIKDVIVDVADGSVSWAVVSVGGFLNIGDKNVAVPCRELTRTSPTDDDVTFTLTASKADLEAMPTFDIDEAKKQGLDRAVQVVEASLSSTGRPTDGAGREPGDGEDEVVVTKTSVGVAVPVAMMLGSEVDDHPVLASGEEFGSISKSIVELAQKRLTHFVVSRGGVLGVGDSEYLIPVAATSLTKRGDELGWAVDKTVKQIEDGGVKYAKPGRGVLDVDVCRRADEFFAVEKKPDGGEPKSDADVRDRRGK